MASATDKFKRSSDTGEIPVVATIQTPRAAGVSTFNVDTQLNWSTTTGIAFSTYKVDANNKKIDGTQVDWEGVSDGVNTISAAARTGGATDTGSAVNDKVEMIITAQWARDLIDGILTGHNQDGSHKALTAPSLTLSGDGSIGGNLAVANSLTIAGRDVSQLVPSGVTSMFAGTTAPTGWLICDGSAVSRTTYAGLFAAVSTGYGNGDGSTTFNLPNFKGRAPFGVDSGQGEFAALGTAGGQKSVQAHAHGVNDPGHAHGTYGIGGVQPALTTGSGSNRTEVNGTGQQYTNGAIGVSASGTGVSIQNAGSGPNNLNPYLAINFIIKT